MIEERWCVRIKNCVFRWTGVFKVRSFDYKFAIDSHLFDVSLFLECIVQCATLDYSRSPSHSRLMVFNKHNPYMHLLIDIFSLRSGFVYPSAVIVVLDTRDKRIK